MRCFYWYAKTSCTRELEKIGFRHSTFLITSGCTNNKAPSVLQIHLARTWKTNHRVGRFCVPCQRSKVHKHTKAPLFQFELSTRHFDHVHIDLVGPLPEFQGHTYLLTMRDRFSRWPEAIPIQNIETQTVARAFIKNWVARFGVPLSMTSDRGAQFTSDLWSAMCNLLGTELHPTMAYHPQWNVVTMT